MALTDFTYFANRSLGGIGAEEIDSDRARAMLSELQKYDPTASFRPSYGNDGQLTGYTLDYDASKLPGLDGGLLGGTSGHGSGADYMPNFSTVQDQMTLANPDATRNSDVYGNVTANTNITQPRTLLDILGPAAVAAFGFGIGGIPGLTEGFGAQFQAPGMSGGGFGATSPFASGVDAGAAVDPWDVMGDPAAYGLGGGAPVDPWDVMGDPSAYGLGGGAPVDPWDVMGDPKAYGLGGGAAPITDLGTPARIGDVIRNGGIPGLDNIWQSIKELPIGDIAKALPGLTGGNKPSLGLLGGGGGGGNNLLALGGGQQKQVEDASAILKRFYESGLLGRA